MIGSRSHLCPVTQELPPIKISDVKAKDLPILLHSAPLTKSLNKFTSVISSWSVFRFSSTNSYSLVLCEVMLTGETGEASRKEV